MQVSCDMREVEAFSRELSKAPLKVIDRAREVFEQSAGEIKTQLRGEMSRSKSFKGITRGITYELNVSAGALVAQVGPERGRPGSLANIAYFGGANGGGGTVPDPKGALDRVAPKFIGELEKALEGLV